MRRSVIDGVRIWLVVGATAACGGPATAPDGSVPRASETTPVEIAERYVSELSADDVVDSVAVAPDLGWVLATAKGADQLLVLDAASGDELRRIGGPGAELGRFAKPNGVAVVGDLALVVERDNARVQVLRLPALTPVGTFGEDVLARPYGLAVTGSVDAGVTVWVTDSVELSEAELTTPPHAVQSAERFTVRVSGSDVAARHDGSLGEGAGDGAIWMVESIGIDPPRDRIVVADEHALRRNLKVFALDGSFTGRVLGGGLFGAEPEGLALWPCGDDGWWIAADQRPGRTVFQVLDRATLEPVASFEGAVTAATDGIGLTVEPVGAMTSGALYAVHDDRAVAAFDLAEVAAALGLDCPPARP